MSHEKEIYAWAKSNNYHISSFIDRVPSTLDESEIMTSKRFSDRTCLVNHWGTAICVKNQKRVRLDFGGEPLTGEY